MAILRTSESTTARYTPDWEKSRQRWAAFWERQILDRPIVIAGALRPGFPPLPERPELTPREKALDTEYQLARFEAAMAATHYAGDAFPCFSPPLGAGILAAYLGAPAQFTPETTWIHPCLDTLDVSDLPRLDRGNEYWQSTVSMMQAAVNRAGDRFMVGITDLGGVTDVLASLRGTEPLLTDMVDQPSAVSRWLKHLTTVWMEAYDELAGLLPAGCGVRSWLPYWTSRRSYPLQNDFSCMISPALFRELCLPELETLTGALDHAFYHLDGPGAVKQVDALLELPRLRAIQWQPGAGGGTATEWLPLLKRIQAAGKGLLIDVRPHEFDTIMRELHPEGVITRVIADATPDQADAFVRHLARWG